MNKISEIKTPETAADKYTKKDFLTKRFLAAKFHESQELVEKTLKSMLSGKVSIDLPRGRKAQAVVYAGMRTPRVHPLGLAKFKEYLDKQKAKL
jgi:hypothetical protein